eukprot:403357899
MESLNNPQTKYEDEELSLNSTYSARDKLAKYQNLQEEKTQSLNYYKSYHGNRGRIFYLYRPDQNPSNLNLWDFTDPVDRVCSNAKKINDTQYICQGHEDGDIFYTTYHGDPEREHNFWIYPPTRTLLNPEWDSYQLICDHCEQQEDGEIDQPTRFKCLGHHKTYHSNGLKCSKVEECPGHATPDSEWSFHGDPQRQHRFWIYPKKSGLVTPKWDFRINPCSNAKKLQSKLFSDWAEYQCQGHHETQQRITKKKGGSSGAAVAILIIQKQERQKYNPCHNCQKILDLNYQLIFTQENQPCKENLKKRFAQLKQKHFGTCKCAQNEAVMSKINEAFELHRKRLQGILDLKSELDQVQKNIFS